MRFDWRALVGSRSFLLELFVGVNLSFLVLDIWVAHSVNEFAEPAEWVPVAFTVAGAVAVFANLLLARPLREAGRSFRERSGFWTGVVVGAAAVLVGVTGLLLHLESSFFQVMTLRSLVYSAPFVAPLAFTGLGLLLLLNRLIPPEHVEWGQWVLFLAWGGFAGNFVLSLADHAQNGFFYATEWVPVVVAAVTVGWLILPVFVRTPAVYLKLGVVVLALAAITGVAGFLLHLNPTLAEEGGSLRDRVIYGPPLFAPLLFPNLALLGALGAWDLLAKGWVREPGSAEPVAAAERGTA